MTTYHATKYSSARDEVIALLSDPMEGFGSEYFGNVDAPTGYVQVVRLTDDCDLDFTDHTNYPVGDEVGEIARTYGVTKADVLGYHVVQTNSSGFVNVESEASAEALETALVALRAQYDAWED